MIASLVFVEVVHLTKQSHHCSLVIQYIAVMPFALSHCSNIPVLLNKGLTPLVCFLHRSLTKALMQKTHNLDVTIIN